MQAKIISYSNPVVEGKELTALQYIAYIARVSSEREDKTVDFEKLIKFLIRNRHWSPFEHFTISIEIETSRAIGRHLLRHRSASFQEFSQRYATPSLSVEPIELRRQAKNNRQCSEDALVEDWQELEKEVEQCLEKVHATYELLLSKGVAKECARMLLPEATKTTIIMTGNLRSWIHFIENREEPGAQKEIRILAARIRRLLKELIGQDLMQINQTI